MISPRMMLLYQAFFTFQILDSSLKCQDQFWISDWSAAFCFETEFWIAKAEIKSFDLDLF